MQPTPDIDLFTVSDTVFAQDLEYEKLSKPHQVFHCIWSLEAEVNNGGFSQFYYNSPGDNARETESALKEIGAEQMADIVRRANTLFGNEGPPKEWEMRQSQLEELEDSIEDKLELLDSEFYQYPDDLETLLKKYVAAHADEFGV